MFMKWFIGLTVAIVLLSSAGAWRIGSMSAVVDCGSTMVVASLNGAHAGTDLFSLSSFRSDITQATQAIVILSVLFSNQTSAFTLS